MSRHGGYTLLEMVVVLALLAMATALVAPAGYRMIQAWRDASEVDAVIGELRALAWRARTEGNALHASAGHVQGADAQATADATRVAAPRIDLPDGWTLVFDTPLHVGANGVCRDTDATLTTARQTLHLHIEGPYCRVRRLTEAR